MNKQNKLARNAIRARKAKNKRANEQDKPKKGKRWLIRLGALVGCLLLVSALVVPCFADTATDGRQEALDKVLTRLNMNNYAYQGAYEQISDVFSYDYLLSGYLNTAVNPFLFESALMGTDELILESYGYLSIDVRGLTDSSGEDAHYYYLGFGYLSVSIQPTDDYSTGGVAVTFYDDDGHSLMHIMYSYTKDNSFYKSTLVGVDLRLDDSSTIFVPSTLPQICVALFSSEEQSAFLPNVAYMLFGSNMSISLRDFSNGYIAPRPIDAPTDVYTAFADMMDVRSVNDSYARLLTYFNGFGDNRLFTYKTLVSGLSDIRYNADYIVQIPLGLGSDIENPQPEGVLNVSSQITLDAFSFVSHTSSLGTPSYVYFSDETLLSMYVYLQAGDIMIELRFQPRNGSITEGLYYRYEGTYSLDGVRVALKSVSYDGQSFSPSRFSKIAISYVVRNGVDVPAFTFINSLLFDNSITDYSDYVYSPYQFYQGYSHAYSLGYTDGERYGYANGYDDGEADGYNQGKQDGFDEGYVEGLADGVGSDAYQKIYNEGYNQAVSEIDSGEFGRNLLGAGLVAPLNALSDFNIIQWRTNDGTLISINLLTILSAIVGVSLFVWFLKMFAGG